MSIEPVRQWLRPSLARRLLFALLGAFVLVWLVLTAQDYWEFQSTGKPDIKQDLGRLANSLAASLGNVADPDQVRIAAATLIKVIDDNLAREEHLEYRYRLQIRDLSGKVVYASQGALVSSITAMEPLSLQTLQGQPTWVAVKATPHWVVILEQRELDFLPLFDPSEMLRYLLIAFPFILLPLLWAISTGLRPLRRLSHHLARRDPSDLTPLALAIPQRELQPVQTAINQLLEKLNLKLQREKTFVHDAAHELQTPLAGILTQAHVLAGEPDPHGRTEALAQLQQGVERASHLVRQLLQLDRLDAGMLGAEERLDIARLAREAMRRHSATAEQKQIQLALEAPDTLVRSTLPHAWHSILDNLLGNALRYCPPHSQVEVTLQQSNAEILLRVADDGPGIAESERERVFERFYRTNGQQVSGSGLGLAIVKQAAAALGGSVTLGVGLHGRGCAFTLRLPSARLAPFSL
ncbi:MAG: ATP-binding protein [Betaproteobacteria bacterium]